MSAGVAAHHVSFIFGQFDDVHEPDVRQRVRHIRPVIVAVEPIVLTLVVVASNQNQSPCLSPVLVQDSAGSILAQILLLLITTHNSH